MVDAIFTCLSDRLPRVLRRLQPGGVRSLIGRYAGWSIRLDLFASFSTNDDADAGLPALLAAAGDDRRLARDETYQVNALFTQPI